MSEGKNIKKYTAADIERYHKGQLSATERHALEKAALDDPFLSDALEGYALAGTNTQADIVELNRRLASRLNASQAKIIPVNKRFSFLRVAAILVLMAGAGILVYQLMFKKNNKQELAVVTEKKVQEPPHDSSANLVSTIDTKDTNKKPSATTREVTVNNSYINPAQKPKRDIAKNKHADGDGVKDYFDEIKSAAPVTVATVPAGKADDFKEAKAERDSLSFERNAVAGNRISTEEQKYRSQKTNTFRGRVTDNSNMGVPFANVTNVQDNAGTYTDANGNFTLTSSDTVLNVQVRSIGYENNNLQLRNDRTNSIKMQEDRSNLSEVVISKQKPNAEARSFMRKSNVTVTEPEPVDGWEKYDSYLANNIEIPDDFRPQEKINNTVEVSFEVDKTGEPVNIKIEKSLCSSCDKEAIRLLKDGPKWKSNANKKGRTTVTIKF